MRSSQDNGGPTFSTWIVAAIALVFASALIPFATVHDGPRSVITVLTAGIGFTVLLLESARRQPSVLTVRLAKVSFCGLALMSFSLIPIGQGLREWLQPGLAPVVNPILNLAQQDHHPLALNPRGALSAIAFTSSCLLLAWATSLTIHRRRYGARLARWLVGIAVAVLFVALAHRLSGATSIWWKSGVPEFSREAFFAPFVNPNHAGLALACALPLCLALAARQRGKEQLIWLPIAVLLGIGVWMTGSRGAVLSSVLGMITLAWLAGQSKIRKATTYGTGTLALLTLVVGPRSIGDALSRWMTPHTYRHDTWGQRPQIWGDTLDLIKGVPLFGAGAGSYADAYKPFRTLESYSTTHHAHQDWLQIAAEHGLLVLICWALVFGILLHKTASAALNANRQRSIPAAFAASLVTLITGMFYDFPMHIGALGVLAALLAGASAGLASRRLQPAGHQATSRFRMGGLILLLCACVPVGLQTYTSGSSESVWADTGPWLQRATLAYERAGKESTEQAKTAGLNIAEMAAKQTLKVRPAEHRALHLIANVSEARGDQMATQEALDLATQLYPTLAGTWIRVARYHRDQGNELLEQQAWKAALTVDLPDGDAPEPIFKEIMKGSNTPAIALQHVLPERADRLRDAGLLLSRTDADEGAEALLRRAATIEPRMGAALGGFLLKTGQHAEALEAVSQLGDSCVTARVAGEALVALERHTEALDRLRVAQRKCDRRDRRVRLAVARARLATERAAGLLLLEQLVVRDPEFHEARRVLLREYRAKNRVTRMLPHLEVLVLAGVATTRESEEIVEIYDLASWTDGERNSTTPSTPADRSSP